MVTVTVALAIGIAGSAAATLPGQNGDLIVSKFSYGFNQIGQVNPQSGKVMLRTPYTDASQVAISPDGSKVAYVDNEHGDFVIQATSKPLGPKKILLGTQDFGFVTFPVFAPDGKSIIFISPSVRSEDAELMEVPVDGGPPTIIMSWPALATDLDISPDGSSITYTLYVPYARSGGTYGYLTHPFVHVADRDGSNDRNLTGDSYSWDSSFSPDGKRVVFVSGEDGDQKLNTIAVDGSGRVDISTPSDQDGFLVNPVFSPDGTKIAYVGSSIGTTTDIPSDMLIVGSDGVPLKRFDGAGQRIFEWSRKHPFLFWGYKPRTQKVKLRTFGPGRVKISGVGIHSSSKNVSRAGDITAPARIKPSVKRRLNRTGKATVTLRVRFAPEGALPSVVSRKVTLRR